MASVVCVCSSNSQLIPEESLYALTTQVVDESLGLTCCSASRIVGQYSLANCGLALLTEVRTEHNEESAPQLYRSDNELVLFKGRLTNSEELHRYTLNCSPEGANDQSMNDAELVARLYSQRKYHFIASLKGRFSFVLFSMKSDILLAARDASGEYQLFQVTSQLPTCCLPHRVSLLRNRSSRSRFGCVASLRNFSFFVFTRFQQEL
jgi:hypothetical protein